MGGYSGQTLQSAFIPFQLQGATARKSRGMLRRNAEESAQLGGLIFPGGNGAYLTATLERGD